MSVVDDDLKERLIPVAAKFIRAYLECNESIQEVIRSMLEILDDPQADADERDMAMSTLADALFPQPYKGQLGMDLEESERDASQESEELHGMTDEMDRQEASFAGRLAQAMKAQDLSQADLAKRIGVGQPAISNMLNRNCRPQKRTVFRLAEALNMAPDELWPGIKAS